MSRPYVSFDPQAEVIGQNVLGFVECTNRERIFPVLEKYGLSEIDPERWYPLQNWLDVLNELDGADGGAMFDFVSIGMKIAETAVYPPEVEQMSFADFVMMLPEVYLMQHRGDTGGQSIEKIGDKHMQLSMRTPYPDDMAYGVVWGMARRFLPEGTQFLIKYDETEPRCDQGGEVTVLDISWK